MASVSCNYETVYWQSPAVRLADALQCVEAYAARVGDDALARAAESLYDWLLEDDERRRMAGSREPVFTAPMTEDRREREREEWDTHRPRLVAAQQDGDR